jgi:hypothetical protein
MATIRDEREGDSDKTDQVDQVHCSAFPTPAHDAVSRHWLPLPQFR